MQRQSTGDEDADREEEGDGAGYDAQAADEGFETLGGLVEVLSLWFVLGRSMLDWEKVDLRYLLAVLF